MPGWLFVPNGFGGFRAEPSSSDGGGSEAAVSLIAGAICIVLGTVVVSLPAAVLVRAAGVTGPRTGIWTLFVSLVLLLATVLGVYAHDRSGKNHSGRKPGAQASPMLRRGLKSSNGGAVTNVGAHAGRSVLTAGSLAVALLAWVVASLALTGIAWLAWASLVTVSVWVHSVPWDAATEYGPMQSVRAVAPGVISLVSLLVVAVSWISYVRDLWTEFG